MSRNLEKKCAENGLWFCVLVLILIALGAIFYLGLTFNEFLVLGLLFLGPPILFAMVYLIANKADHSRH